MAFSEPTIQSRVGISSPAEDIDFLTNLYDAVLHRPIEPQGLRDYLIRLQSGTPRNVIEGEVRASPEAMEKNRPLPTPPAAPQPAVQGTNLSIASEAMVLALDGAQFLSAAYLATLGRAIDVAGEAGYLQALASGSTKHEVLADLRGSEEGCLFAARAAGSEDLLKLSLTGHVSPLTAESLDEILPLHDLQFVICAYHSLLGRPPDVEGGNYYLDRLRAGEPKVRLLSEIAASQESIDSGKRLKGMRQATRRMNLASLPLIGWCFRSWLGYEGDTALERRVRALENYTAHLKVR